MIQIKAKDSNGEFLTTLVQWDTGITVYLAHELITEAYEVHFANTEDGTAVVVEGEYTDGVLSADIPDALLEDVEPILGYVYDGTKSILNFRINITPRAMPVSTSEEEETEEATATAAVMSVEIKDVTFVDHDGTALYSCTWDEISELTELPELPSWTAGTEYGLEIPMTCTGWNWSLESIQNYATYGGLLTVGAVYEPTDGKTHLVIQADTDFDICLNLYNSTADTALYVDWGDGASDSTIDTGDVTFTHTYSDDAYYDIVIEGDDYLLGTSTGGLAVSTAASFTVSGDLLALQRLIAAFLGASCSGVNSYCFANCRALRQVTIPNNVTSINNYAFYYCYSLAVLIVPSSVTDVGGNVFDHCCILTLLTMPDGVTSIEDYAFQNCCALTSLTIPASVTSIGNYAFQNCYALTSLTIPASVTSIGIYAFQSCYTLTSLTIPASVTSIGNYAFQNCYALASLTISDGVTSIGTYGFQYCLALTSLTIPDSVTSLGNYAFRYSGLVNLDGLYVASTATQMFYYVYDLVNLTNVRYIGANINFSYCSKLTADSLNNIIAALRDDGDGYTLTLGDTNLAKLTDDEIAVATDKGWTVA